MASSDRTPKEGPTIGMVAGEVSGDYLGQYLMDQIKAFYPNARFIGIGGERMISQGLQSQFSMNDVNAIGVTEVLKKLPKLYRIQNQLVNQFVHADIDWFVGVDFTDFNLRLAKKLKDKGIITMQYKTPSAWAWRSGRVKKIKVAYDYLFSLFPFENIFFEKHGQAISCLGHPLVKEIPLLPNKVAAKAKLGLQDEFTIAMLPGSRDQEIARVGKLILESMQRIQFQTRTIQLCTSLLNDTQASAFRALQAQYAPDLKIQYFQNESKSLLAAADLALLGSGTVTFEALLHKTPMVVTYKMSKLSEFVVKRLIKIPFIALPNLLAQKTLVPELVGKQAFPNQIADAMSTLIQNEQDQQAQIHEFHQLHEALMTHSSQALQQCFADMPEFHCA